MRTGLALLVSILVCPGVAAAQDLDGDGLPNGDESTAGTDPSDPDSDDDTVPDGAEVWLTATDPLFDERGCSGWGATQLTNGALGARSVGTADIDGDGDADVLFGSASDDTVGWFENLGGGSFGPVQVISSTVDYVQAVHAADLDADGDIDVLSAGGYGTAVWHENLGGGSFGPDQPFSTSGHGMSVHAADMDGDGDVDVVSASGSTYYDSDDAALSVHENLGGGLFGPTEVISTEPSESVFAVDLDSDGDVDLLQASTSTYYYYSSGFVAWYENLGWGEFGPAQVLSNDPAATASAADLDGDGDADVLLTWYWDDEISWRENLGGGSFGPEVVIATSVNAPQTVVAEDLDGDHDLHPGAVEVISDQGIDTQQILARCIGPIPDGKSIFYQKHMTLHLLPELDRSWLSVTG